MTKEIPLTRGKVALVDDADYDYLSQYRWCAISSDSKWYAMRSARLAGGLRQEFLMHRLILDAPTGVHVDHRDGDGLNNQRSNLRLCTHQENMRNRKLQVNNTSGYKGVIWHKDKRRWHARIYVDSKMKHIGYFDTPEAAALAYNKAAAEIFGEFARLNVV